MNVVTPIVSTVRNPKQRLNFAGNENNDRLYAPLQKKGGSDRFEHNSEGRLLYPPIEVLAPDLPTSILQPTALNSNANIGVSREAFIQSEVERLEQSNPPINLESIQRRMNIQAVLETSIRAIAGMTTVGTTHGWGVVFLPLINIVSSKVAAWTAYKINDNMLGKALHGAYTFAQKGFSKVLSLLEPKDKKGVQFAGHEPQVKKATASPATQLISHTLSAIQQFCQTLQQGPQPESRSQLAAQLFGNLFTSLSEYIAQAGKASDKTKLTLLKKIQAETQAITQELPATAKNYNDLPVPTRKKLLGVVYDAVTSEMPVVIQWGEGLAQDLGIDTKRIHQLKGSTQNVG